MIVFNLLRLEGNPVPRLRFQREDRLDVIFTFLVAGVEVRTTIRAVFNTSNRRPNFSRNIYGFHI